MKQHGFTLIELMIVVTVVAILAAIAVPIFSEQLAKGKRADAFATMSSNAQSLERWYSLNNTYAGYALTTVEQQSPANGTAEYAVSLVSAPGTFTLSAVPRNTSDRCGTLTLTHTGVKGAAVADCF